MDKLTFDAAVALLPDGEYIHTFRNPGGMLLGADLPRDSILEIIKENGAELSGELATRMGHGLAVYDGKWLFIATNPPSGKGTGK